MRYLALATDYDGTLASHDRVSEQATRALERLRISGRRAILVTGRRLIDLLAACPCARLFDRIVAENGAILYNPANRETTRLAKPASELLVQSLQRRGVEPLEVGQVVVATHAVHRVAVQDVIWQLGQGQLPFAMHPQPDRAERIRHHRKYAEGDLRQHSFCFRGPDGRHDLKAQNLAVFCQIARGIDETTWTFHLHRGDYSRWFRHVIKDDYLADETQRIERRADVAHQQTRQMIEELVNARYTLPE